VLLWHLKPSRGREDEGQGYRLTGQAHAQARAQVAFLSVAWDFSTEPEFERSLEWMREFVRERIWPLETIHDELGWDGLQRAIKPLQAEVREHGLWAAHLDRELGGQGFGQVKLGLMHEILGTCPIAPLAFGNAAPDSGNSEILAMAGSAEQKERYLHPLLAGDLKSAFSMTEPDTAGSDPTLLSTRATRDGDEWVINGHKWFSSNGSIADFLIVMAVTDPDARPHQRASMFVVDADAAGVQIVRDVSTMEHPYESFGRYGNHAEILYENVRIPGGALLGAEGAGFLIAQQRLYPGRIHHCMRWLGVARRAFDMLCERSLYRYTHGTTLGKHQTVQNWIADSEAEMQAARLMTLHAAWKMDTDGVASARKEIALIKFFGAKVLHDVVDRALQAHGALGYSTDLPLEAMYRYARAARIYDGPDEVHRASVARQLLRGYEPPPDGVPSEYIPARREAARLQFAEMLDAVTAND
jgi:acyl-CoA dehydrogenase